MRHLKGMVTVVHEWLLKLEVWPLCQGFLGMGCTIKQKTDCVSPCYVSELGDRWATPDRETHTVTTAAGKVKISR